MGKKGENAGSVFSVSAVGLHVLLDALREISKIRNTNKHWPAQPRDLYKLNSYDKTDATYPMAVNINTSKPGIMASSYSARGTKTLQVTDRTLRLTCPTIYPEHRTTKLCNDMHQTRDVSQ